MPSGKGAGKDKLTESLNKNLQKGRWQKALADARGLLEADPNDLRLRIKLGDIYARLGKNSDAIREYLLAAQGYAESGDLVKAIAANKMIVRLDPSLDDIHRDLARLYQERGFSVEPASARAAPGGAGGKTGRKRVPLLSELNPDEFQELVSRMKVHEVPKGGIVFHEGDQHQSLFIISTGEVKVVGRDARSRLRVLATLREDDFFGEVAALSGKPRMATVVASTSAQLLECAEADLDDVVHKFPSVGTLLKDFYTRRLQDTQQKLQPS